MAVDMKVTIRTIKNTDTEPSSGQMEGSISETGAKVNSMARVSTSKRARRDKASGRWARESSGSKMLEAEKVKAEETEDTKQADRKTTSK